MQNARLDLKRYQDAGEAVPQQQVAAASASAWPPRPTPRS
jgi:hypothetical protein